MPPGTDTTARLGTVDAAPTRSTDRAHALRADIQWLRGLAVLAVLIYHADKTLLPGGYLGVDVFFVLSGYLITGNILRDMRRGTFSYAAFIARRFRRLLPACYAMLATTLLIGGALLTRGELFELVKQMSGTIGFASNVVLWQQAGYFDTSSALKPLLHTWSLSLEEQYYLALPVLLWLGSRLRPIVPITAALLASMIVCFAFVPHKPSAVFFLLPFRAWELLAGSFCAALALEKRVPPIPDGLKFAALVAIGLALMFPPDAPHPGPGALIVVAMTALLMLGAIDFGNSVPNRAMIFLGDISYSLYLFHWPLFAMANIVYADTVPPRVTTLLISASLLLAVLSWRFVEQPFRKGSGIAHRRVYLLATAAGAALLLGGFLLHASRPAGAITSPAPTAHAPNYGLDRICAANDAIVDRPECRTSPEPSILLWGDSYAMHLVQGLQAQTEQMQHSQPAQFDFMQATKTLCGPVPDVAPLAGTFRDDWAKSCLAFNDSVLRFLDAHPEIRVVVLASKWRQFFSDDTIDAFVIRDDAGVTKRAGPALETSVVGERVRKLIERIVAGGRQVVLVLPPPSASFDIRRCSERRREELPFIGAPEDCGIDAAASGSRDAVLTRTLANAAKATGASVFSFAPALCRDGRCLTEIDGVMLYQDEGHFSARGSALVGERSGLNRLVAGLAPTANRPRPVTTAKGHR